ncbi:DUF6273 domain-containing protein [Bifidobacterium pseudocatenulatum]|uniref:DUF6273 domain-containing protein n=1 Tax=Bifidobacterium pseudocatenulatum TaxID=28026 RepID=UPI00080B093F|nr:DUF6273 domain-containing protein [Bifidobacterium pseudocatenulatum]MCB4877037.1 hypothetical protein [Bifidobacterium pseudocatenulatum]
MVQLLASLAILGAVCGGFLTGSAIAAEPAKCNTSVDKVCYAGYNAAGLKQIADDLSEKGKGSSYYAEMENNLTKGTAGSLTLSDGSNLPFRLIGILHDDKADGSGRKAGLTFMAWNALPKAYAMNNSSTNEGGWRDSLLRNQMNNGEIWNQFPTDFQNNVTPVLKQTNNMDYGYTVGSSASATADKVWLVSYRELVSTLYDGWKTSGGFQALSQEGSQYEYFQGKVTNNYSANRILSGIYATVSGSAPVGANYNRWWERSPNPHSDSSFLLVNSGGDPSRSDDAYCRCSVVPAFSF